MNILYLFYALINGLPIDEQTAAAQNLKLNIYLRELNDNSLFLILVNEPQNQNFIIRDYTVRYTNKHSNKEMARTEFNLDSRKRIVVELNNLNENTAYKICIKATLVTCEIKESDQESFKDSNNYRVICNNIVNSTHYGNSIESCIDNIITNRSNSLQVLGSSIGAILSLLLVMSFVYFVQNYKSDTTDQICLYEKSILSDTENV